MLFFEPLVIGDILLIVLIVGIVILSVLVSGLIFAIERIVAWGLAKRRVKNITRYS